jgi:predicted dehydrogenase
VKLGIGLAGVGRMGRIHATNLVSHCARAGLACVYDADRERASALAAQLGVPVTASFEELLERSAAVAIATPTATHAELSLAAARAGRPVFCEKPLSLDRAATVETIEAVETTGGSTRTGWPRPIASTPASWARSRCSARRCGT